MIFLPVTPNIYCFNLQIQLSFFYIFIYCISLSLIISFTAQQNWLENRVLAWHISEDAPVLVFLYLSQFGPTVDQSRGHI